MSNSHFELLVIGGGPAGMAGALAAGAFGKKAAVIERSAEVGGAGANTGTIPSKTLRESALVISGSRSRKLLGLDISVRPKAKLEEFTHHAHTVSAAERGRLERRIHETGVQRIHGQASFADPHTLRVIGAGGSTTTYSADFILIATGSSPVRPSLFPFEHERVHDSDELLKIRELPKTLAVVGAGVIGAEYASTFAALGVRVHLIDGRQALLPFLDSDISAAITRGMKAAGIELHWGTNVEQCRAMDNDSLVLTLSSGETLGVTDVLVAAGRKVHTSELNLAAAGLSTKENGLLSVSENYCSEVQNIYAAGDVVGAPALAATGMEQARVAVLHAFNLLPKQSANILPTGIYTIPEASMAGRTEQELAKSGIDYIVGKAKYADNARGQIIGDQEGFLKLIFAREEMKLLGVHAVGEQASELVHIGLVALHCGATADLFSNVCFNYPTLGDLYKYAAYDAMMKVVNASS